MRSCNHLVLSEPYGPTQLLPPPRMFTPQLFFVLYIKKILPDSPVSIAFVRLHSNNLGHELSTKEETCEIRHWKTKTRNHNTSKVRNFISAVLRTCINCFKQWDGAVLIYIPSFVLRSWRFIDLFGVMNADDHVFWWRRHVFQTEKSSCECNKQEVEDSQQGMILVLGEWWDQRLMTTNVKNHHVTNGIKHNSICPCIRASAGVLRTTFWNLRNP
jgi:hypothetical protein